MPSADLMETTPRRRWTFAGPWDASPAEAARWESARGALPRIVAAAQFALVAATASLWLLPWRFPAVPLTSAAVALPPAWDAAAGTLLLLGWAGVAAFAEGSRGRRIGLALVVVAFPIAAALNQHRLQPWAWHGWLFAVAWLGTPPSERAGWLRLLTVAIYFYSALSKLDYTFLHDLGPVLWTAAGKACGLPEAWCTASAGPETAWLLPAGELCVAAWLASGRARRGATLAAAAMHGLLLSALGPWGLSHSAGVLGWNVLFLCWTTLLFWPVAASPPDAHAAMFAPHAPVSSAAWAWTVWPARLVLAAAMLLPLAEPWGGFDLWLSWGLYAPKNERVSLWIERASREALPAWARVEASSEPPPPDLPATWVRIRLDRAALRVVGAPLYPQQRFQLGAALAASAALPEDHVAVVQEGAASRWDGRRRRTLLLGRRAIEAAARTDFLWNALPRSWAGE